MHDNILEDEAKKEQRAAKDKAAAEIARTYRKRLVLPPKLDNSVTPPPAPQPVLQGNGDGNEGEEVVIMDFEDENGVDGDKALDKVDSIKVAWDPNDLKFFFTEIEDAMDMIKIKSQWLKRQVINHVE